MAPPLFVGNDRSNPTLFSALYTLRVSHRNSTFAVFLFHMHHRISIGECVCPSVCWSFPFFFYRIDMQMIWAVLKIMMSVASSWLRMGNSITRKSSKSSFHYLPRWPIRLKGLFSMEFKFENMFRMVFWGKKNDFIDHLWLRWPEVGPAYVIGNT